MSKNEKKVVGVSDYSYGADINVKLMPAVNEEVSFTTQAELDKLVFKPFDRRTVDFGEGQFPLNIYGPDGNFKAMPGIGDLVH